MKKIRWAFGGKSGYEAMLQEMKDWKTEVNEVLDAIKLLQDKVKEEDRQLYKQLFDAGGIGVQRAYVMDGIINRTSGTSIFNRGATGDLHSTHVDALFVLQHLTD